MTKPAYTLYTTKEFGEIYWVLREAASQEFGRYETKTEAMRDVRRYGLKVDQVVNNFSRR